MLFVLVTISIAARHDTSLTQDNEKKMPTDYTDYSDFFMFFL